jgi:serine O-acetyltransferase
LPLNQDIVDKYFQYRDRFNNGDEKVKKRIRPKLEKIEFQTGSFIGIGASFSDIPCFPHGFFGIHISRGAVIGTGCVIFHEVTIGSNTLLASKSQGSPTIGNNVYIGAGAKIIGNVRIGNNVRIGANCVVTSDIPDNSTVVMGKPRVIMHSELRDNTFYPFDEPPC